MEWILSLCCGVTRKKYIVALLGRQEDQRHVLKHSVSGYKEDKSLRPFSEDTCIANGMELIFQSLDDNADLYEIRGIHTSLAAAVVFAVNADNKASVERCIALINEDAIKTRDTIVVLCRSDIYGSEAVQELKRTCDEIAHGKIEFILYEESKAFLGVHKGINWICNRLEE
ncbi:hypothetical protein [Encephalitozoon cuniculi GB-M1]|uniref:Uncharacterized protein n=2 Tax=Encephalitozoon cuniculi TaxID=6035 RepID=Q8SWM8_ENCCU|nr:uncharacterized protein ECU01_0590 [Encephalitozoon cuniculi GB-M1]AGE96095.1 hypothetical protein ECU01_0590 [Encephalitozoon cuniculi]KMV66713.1 hypothetical protein M970_010420 [Encephalitozoon cuniculi EcunIII-L]UYI28429.1 putative ADP-ribosylation factor [Encephalitozoon cuniculi]CAD24929.1 hypothetical protein [Encephalitozoon cuniculi GB-M1]